MDTAMNLKKLINCVYTRPSLWDQRNEGYNNKLKLKKIWDEIAEEMNCQAEVCRQKWRSLRDVFRRELKKYHSRLLDPNISDKALPRWYYFRELYFLTDQMLGIDNNIPDLTPESSEESFESFYVKNNSCIVKDEPDGIEEEEVILDDTSDDIFLTFTDNSEHNQAENSESVGKNVKCFKDSTRELLKRPVNALSCVQEDKKKPRLADRGKEDNSDYHFLMSLLPYLKAVPHKRKLLVRTKIQNIFCEEMGDTDKQ